MYNINHRIGMNKGVVILLGKLCQQSITVAFVGIGSVIHRGTVHFPYLWRVGLVKVVEPSKKYPNMKPPKHCFFFVNRISNFQNILKNWNKQLLNTLKVEKLHIQIFWNQSLINILTPSSLVSIPKSKF